MQAIVVLSLVFAVTMPSALAGAAAAGDAGTPATAAKKKCKKGKKDGKGEKDGRATAAKKKCGKKKEQPSDALLSISPTSHYYGDVGFPGTSPPKTFTVANTGGSPSGALGSTITGPNADRFAISQNSCTGALAAFSTCTVSVTYTPSNFVTPVETGTLNVSGSPGGTASAALSGIGI